MDGYITIGTKLNTEDFEREIKFVQDQLEGLEEEYNVIKNSKPFEGQEQALRKVSREILETKKRLGSLINQQSKLNGAGLANMQKSVESVGKSVENVGSKMGRWALALIGIRSIYGLITGSLNTLMQYDDQLATNVEYIKFMIANTLQPVIEAIVNLVYKLLIYVNYLAQAWFGIDLFAGSMEKYLKKSNKQAQELRKSLLGFDEMNVISDSGTTGAVGGVPNLPPPEDVEIPSWLKWLKDNGEDLIPTLLGIGGGLLALKLGFEPLQALGIGVAIDGVATSLKACLDYVDDPSWENFGKAIEGAGESMVGFGIATNNWGLAGIGAIVMLYGKFLEYWPKIKDFFQNGIDWLTDKSDWVRENFGDVFGDIYDTIVGTLQDVLDYFDGAFSAYKKIFSGFIEFFKGVFTGNWKQAWEGIKKIFSGIIDNMINNIKTGWKMVKNIALMAFNGIRQGLDILKGILVTPINLIIEGINAVTSGLNKLSFTVPDWVPVFGGKSWGFDIPKIPKLARGGIVNNPGSGVMMGNYVAGEKGSEAVLPLDDNTMDRLGEAIARHMNITNDNKIYMNARQIARQMNITNAENSFASNR